MEDKTTIFENKPNKEIEIKLLGFRRSRFLTVIKFWVGSIAFILVFITERATEYVPNREIALIIAILGIGFTIGFLKRKKFAVYLVYTILILSIWGGIMFLIEGLTDSFDSLILGVIILLMACSWFRFFQKRKEWFK